MEVFCYILFLYTVILYGVCLWYTEVCIACNRFCNMMTEFKGYKAEFNDKCCYHRRYYWVTYSLWFEHSVWHFIVDKETCLQATCLKVIFDYFFSRTLPLFVTIDWPLRLDPRRQKRLYNSIFIFQSIIYFLSFLFFLRQAGPILFVTAVLL